MQKRMSNSTLYAAQGAVTAALYVSLTLLSQMLGLTSLAVQIRFSEALCVLPFFGFAAVPGLTIGCVLANLLLGSTPWDVVFGSLATLIGAVGTRLLRKYRLLPYLPPIAANTLIVTPILIWIYGFLGDTPVWLFYLIFFAGEAASVFLFGSLLRTALKKIRFKG